jgi:Putative zinc-finger
MGRGGTGMEACHNQKKKLILYVHGELDSSSGKKIENHLAKCKSCRSEYQQLLSLMGEIRKTASSPELSPKQINSLVINIKSKLRDRNKEKWWRKYRDYRPLHMVPVIATACILIIAVGIIGYEKITETNQLPPLSGRQNAEIMLSDRDLEIIKNLEFLKEMDAIRKLSKVVDSNKEINPQGELDNDTRGMRQDAYRKYFV